MKISALKENDNHEVRVSLSPESIKLFRKKSIFDGIFRVEVCNPTYRRKFARLLSHFH